jgi:putative transcriptional regulator
MVTKADKQIISGLRSALKIAKGKAKKDTFRVYPDVAELRKKLNLSQTEFARTFHFTPSRVRDWEQGRFQPDAATSAYLTVIEKHPETVKKAIKAA